MTRDEKQRIAANALDLVLRSLLAGWLGSIATGVPWEQLAAGVAAAYFGLGVVVYRIAVSIRMGLKP